MFNDKKIFSSMNIKNTKYVLEKVGGKGEIIKKRTVKIAAYTFLSKKN